MQALQDIRVMELSRTAPTSYAGMILGDMGAEVIKIEQPPEPDTPRIGSGWSPFGEEMRKEALFRAINRNKRSIAVNLRSQEGAKVFCELAKRADVILECFRPGVMKRLQLDYQTIQKINPRIIYASLTGYGQDGPYCELPGHDINYIAFGGALGLIGKTDEAPVVPLNLLGDYAAGSLNIVIGILIAIIAREKTGKGQYIDIAMTDGVASLLTNIASSYFKGEKIIKRGKNTFSGLFSCYSVYQTRDRKYISIGCYEPWLWSNLCKALEVEEFIPFQWIDDKQEEMISKLRSIFLSKDRDEWFDFLKNKNVCIAKVYEIDEVFSDPQLLHRNMLLEFEHATEGKVQHVGIAVKLSDTPGEVKNLSPTLGEHTQEILISLGYNENEIMTMRQARIIN